MEKEFLVKLYDFYVYANRDVFIELWGKSRGFDLYTKYIGYGWDLLKLLILELSQKEFDVFLSYIGVSK